MNKKHLPEGKMPELPVELLDKINEMQGYSQLGMAKDALKLAKELLNHRPAHKTVFNEALWTILIQADRCKQWRRAVESTFAELSNTNQKALSQTMLRFYFTVEDYQAAEQFIPKHARTAEDLVFSMWTLLELRKPQQAKRIWRKCRKLLLRTQDRFSSAMLIDALADYHAQIGELSAAEEYWLKAPAGEPVYENATRGLVKIQAVRGQHYVAAGLSNLKNLGADSDFDSELVLPGNTNILMTKSCKELIKYSAALFRIVPKDQLWRFGT